MSNLLERAFHLRENHTTPRTEVFAGLTTFMTMAYILAVNPIILSAAGMDSGAVFTATALASALATVFMALLSNYPFALAPGMGLNAYFAYTIVLKMGYSWQMALAAVFVEGIVFVVLSVTPVRERIFNSIPMCLKHAVSAGIGLFIAFIGLQNCGLVVAVDGTLVGMFSFSQSAAQGTFSTAGISALLALAGVCITGILVVRQVRGSILLGILATWVLGIACQLAGLYVPDPAGGFASLLPDFSRGLAVPRLAPTLGQMDFSQLLSPDFLIVVFALLFVDVFDTLGGLIGIASEANMLDEQGRLPRIRGALLSDALGTCAGAVLGTSTTTTFIESAAGVSVGGRTGLSGLVTAGLFVVSLLLSPIFLAIPSFATAPALIIVGAMILKTIAKVDFKNPLEYIPAFLCVLAVPLFYSISEGIALGVLSYAVLHLAAGPEERRKAGPFIYILAFLFLLKYIFL